VNVAEPDLKLLLSAVKLGDEVVINAAGGKCVQDEQL
jgi:hypothetical protein